MSLNQVQLIGNVGRDPEIRRLNNGDAVANLTIATGDKWKDKNTGEWKERTEWHNVVVFGGLAGVIENYVKKGSKLYVSGELQTRKWQDRDGNDRYSTEVVLRGPAAKMEMLDGRGGGQSGNSYDAPPQNEPQANGIDDDEIPF